MEMMNNGPKVKLFRMEADEWIDQDMGYLNLVENNKLISERADLEPSAMALCVVHEQNGTILHISPMFRNSNLDIADKQFLLWTDGDHKSFAAYFVNSSELEPFHEATYSALTHGMVPDASELVAPPVLPEPSFVSVSTIVEALDSVKLKRTLNVLVKNMCDTNYIPKLFQVFTEAEEDNRIDVCCEVGDVVRALIDFGVTALYEALMNMHIEMLGALEYEDGVRRHNHREAISKTLVRHVVPMESSDTMGIVVVNFRLTYLRDVACSNGNLSDTANKELSFLIKSTALRVVEALGNDTQLPEKLAALVDLESPDPEQVRKVVNFLNHFFVMFRNLPSDDSNKVGAVEDLTNALLAHDLLAILGVGLEVGDLECRLMIASIIRSVMSVVPAVRLSAITNQPVRKRTPSDSATPLDVSPSQDAAGGVVSEVGGSSFFDVLFAAMGRETDPGVLSQLMDVSQQLLGEPEMGSSHEMAQEKPRFLATFYAGPVHRLKSILVTHMDFVKPKDREVVERIAGADSLAAATAAAAKAPARVTETPEQISGGLATMKAFRVPTPRFGLMTIAQLLDPSTVVGAPPRPSSASSSSLLAPATPARLRPTRPITVPSTPTIPGAEPEQKRTPASSHTVAQFVANEEGKGSSQAEGSKNPGVLAFPKFTHSCSRPRAIIDLLQFLITAHPEEACLWATTNSVVGVVAAYALHPEAHVRLAVVRFMLSCISLPSSGMNGIIGLDMESGAASPATLKKVTSRYVRHIEVHGLLEPLMRCLLCNGFRDNLINSSLLWLLETIRSQNSKVLLKWLQKHHHGLLLNCPSAQFGRTCANILELARNPRKKAGKLTNLPGLFPGEPSAPVNPLHRHSHFRDFRALDDMEDDDDEEEDNDGGFNSFFGDCASEGLDGEKAEHFTPMSRADTSFLDSDSSDEEMGVFGSGGRGSGEDVSMDGGSPTTPNQGRTGKAAASLLELSGSPTTAGASGLEPMSPVMNRTAQGPSTPMVRRGGVSHASNYSLFKDGGMEEKPKGLNLLDDEDDDNLVHNSGKLPGVCFDSAPGDIAP